MNLINFQNNQTKLNKAMFDEFQNNIKEAIESIYPVGSIYMSVNEVNPGTLFGGEWEQIKDRFLLACGDTYSNGSTGGEATHKLTVDEMPSHNHKNYNARWSQLGYQSGGGMWGFSADSAEEPQILKAVGGNQEHNNMPPYLAVYMWKRVS